MNVKRLLSFFIAFVLFSLFVHYLLYIRRYQQGYDYESVSNALFIVGVVTFFPALMAELGSYKLFYGIQYALRGIVSGEFRDRYKKFSDYLLDKSVSLKTSVYVEIMLASGVLIAASVAFAFMWGRTLW